MLDVHGGTACDRYTPTATFRTVLLVIRVRILYGLFWRYVQAGMELYLGEFGAFQSLPLLLAIPLKFTGHEKELWSSWRSNAGMLVAWRG